MIRRQFKDMGSGCCCHYQLCGVCGTLLLHCVVFCSFLFGFVEDGVCGCLSKVFVGWLYPLQFYFFIWSCMGSVWKVGHLLLALINRYMYYCYRTVWDSGLWLL
jgi:hypothetical protein